MSAAAACAAAALLVSFTSCGDVTSTSIVPIATDQTADRQDSGQDPAPDPGLQRPPLKPTHFLVWGQITSEKQPLAGVRVSGGEATDTSGADGAYEVYLPPGSHALVFTKDGFEKLTKQVAGSVDSDLRADIPLRARQSPEYVVRRGDRVERTVDPRGGWIEFDVWVPEDGRADDWDMSPICSIYEGTYHGKQLGLVDLLPYKLKWCYAEECAEPRYNLKWNQWRHVRLEWTAREVFATVDGARVGGKLKGTFGAQTKLFYGEPPAHRAPLAGARIKNVVWSR